MTGQITMFDQDILDEINELALLGTLKLMNRFNNKIDCEEYYLSYSGGKDSHLLYYFIKNILKNDTIKIVGLNTYREHAEIRDRLYKYCDVVLYPTMKMAEINKKYGMPCFTKGQDEIIERYQRGNRTDYTLSRINGTNTTLFAFSKLAKELTLNQTLHKVSNKCCKYTKKEPLNKYAKETKLKAIIGVRTSEGVTRKGAYHSCLSESGKFSPLYDFTNKMVEAMYKYYNIEIPKIYDYLDRTGCIGCPYARNSGNLEKELTLITKNQLKYAVDSFKLSYDVLKIKYQTD